MANGAVLERNLSLLELGCGPICVAVVAVVCYAGLNKGTSKIWSETQLQVNAKISTTFQLDSTINCQQETTDFTFLRRSDKFGNNRSCFECQTVMLCSQNIPLQQLSAVFSFQKRRIAVPLQAVAAEMRHEANLECRSATHARARTHSSGRTGHQL